MGSGDSGRRLAGPLRGMPRLLTLLALGAVARAGLLAVADTLGVEHAADDLVADAGQVLDPAAAYQHDRVLLQVVADAGDVRGDLDAAVQPHPADLAERRVGLLGRGRVDARANPPPLGRALEGRGLGLLDLAPAALANQLGDRRQSLLLAVRSCCSFNSTVSGVQAAPRPSCIDWSCSVAGRDRDRDRAWRLGSGSQPERAGQRRSGLGARHRRCGEAQWRMVAKPG